MWRRLFHRWVLRWRWVTFAMLGIAFLIFGAASLNLVFVLKANFDLIFQHGWQALMDGAAQQLLEIVFTGYISMAAYIVFKLCEYALVHDLIQAPESEFLP